MNAFRWSMRHGAMILFTAAILVLVISFANYFFLSGAALNQSLSVEGLSNSKFVLFWGALAQALSNAVWPFLGACVVDRIDRNWTKGDRK